MTDALSGRDLIFNFIEYCKECGYGSSYDQTELIDSYIKRVYKHITNWEQEQMMQRYGNMHLFYSVINEFSDPTEIYLVRKEDNKIVGRMVDVKFE